MLPPLPFAAEPWLGLGGECLLAVLVALLIHQIAGRLLSRLAKPHPVPAMLLASLRRPVLWVFIFAALEIVLRAAPDMLAGIRLIRHANSLGMIAALTWSAVCVVDAVARAVVDVNPANIEGNLQARRIQTQAKVLSRSVMAMLTLFGISAALMTFPSVRQFGTGLMASAGVAGLVVGFAAKPVLGNLLAGLQIAITQPIRLDDAVIVEGEWGWIDEITGTYVVVRLWDQRRLIVPLQWFIEHPFQNWTRTSSEILGSVFLWVDYGLPIEVLRQEAKRLCEEAPEWDQRTCLIQVTDTNERAMQLRVLVSAADSPRCWDLRCKLREGLIAFVQRQYPQCLPRIRAEYTVAENRAVGAGHAPI